jgi:hypothetical protein
MKILSTNKYIELITRIKDLEHENEMLKTRPKQELTEEQKLKKEKLEAQLEALSNYSVATATGRGNKDENK